MTALAKGVGFGAALALPAVAAVVLWDRDGAAFRRLLSVRGAILALILALAWPLAAAARHPGAASLWTMHVADRFASRPEHFIGGPRWQYLPAVLLQALPWTPLALLGMGPSLVRARGERGGGDRLLWAWAVVPVVVLSMATVKNAHYAIHALPPWSIWAALGLARVERVARSRPWWGPTRSRRIAVALFATIGLAVAAGFTCVAPHLDARGREWGLLRGDRPDPRPGHPARLPLRGLGPQALPHPLRPGPARLGDPPVLLPPPRRLAPGRRRPPRPPPRPAGRRLRPPRPRP